MPTDQTQSTDQATMVQFPGDPVAATDKDVAVPLVGLLHALYLVGTDEEVQAYKGPGAVLGSPPQGVAIVEAGATWLTKAWSTALATGFSATAVVAAVKGVWSDEHDIVRVAMVSGAAIVLAALGLAIAIMVSSDVRARAAGAVAIADARARVATTFLTLTRPMTMAATALSANGHAVAEPSITQLVPATFTGVSSKAQGVTLTVAALGTDAGGSTWCFAIQPGQPPQWIPRSDLASASA